MATIDAAFHELVGVREGWVWPSRDIYGFNAILDESRDAARIISHCERRHVAVQAGGNCGLMVKPLAAAFARVYTFEPDPINFYCLACNVPELNVFKLQACLGESGPTVALQQHDTNTAAHFVAGSHKGSLRGAVPMLSVDQMQLGACDLLMLDIEGFEMQALQGAQRTIAEFKPTICVELIGHGKRYGVDDETVIGWLRWKGYRPVDKLLRDTIFKAT